MHPTIRNRIVDHVKVRAGDLVPHPLNYREHPADQRQALAGSLEEIGFARSLLGYRRPDGKIQLIDGHLRAEFDPDLEVTVELVDVTDEEARKLLLTLDPLAALAQVNAANHARLRQMTPTRSDALDRLWQLQAAQEGKLKDLHEQQAAPPTPEQFLVLVRCRDEGHQKELLQRFEDEGLSCRALVS
jgi:hypothetical protein